MEARLGKTQEEARQEADARRRLVPQVHALADDCCLIHNFFKSQP
jgi:hypothetical protein